MTTTHGLNFFFSHVHVMVHRTLSCLLVSHCPTSPHFSSSYLITTSLGWLWCLSVMLNFGVQRYSYIHWLWRQWLIPNPWPRSSVLNLKDNTFYGVFVPLTELRFYRVLLDRYLHWYCILTISKVSWMFFLFLLSYDSLNPCMHLTVLLTFYNHLVQRCIKLIFFFVL